MAVVLNLQTRRRTATTSTSPRTVTPPDPAHSSSIVVLHGRMTEQIGYLSVASPHGLKMFADMLEGHALDYGWTPRRPGGAA